MIDIEKLSSHYTARSLSPSNVDDVIGLCRQNTVFYEYTEARPTRENILHDMNATPPGIEPADKYYFGFYEGADLIAIMDYDISD